MQFKPGRDAGCISSHRNPNTRRHHNRSGYPIPDRYARDYRVRVNAAVRKFVDNRIYETDLALSIAPIRRPWSGGDKLSYNPVVIA